MVYIKLNDSLQTLLKPYLKGQKQKQKIIKLDKTDQYITYSLFKQIAKNYKLSIHQYVKRSDIIMQIEMERLKELANRTPVQKKFAEQLKSKHQIRMLNKYKGFNQKTYYFQENKQQSIKDLSSSLSFGITFIFSFFMAGLSGYYFGTYFLGFQLAKALMVSLAFIIIIMVVETLLYIIKQDRQIKLQRIKQRQKNKNQYHNVTYNCKNNSTQNLFRNASNINQQQQDMKNQFDKKNV